MEVGDEVFLKDRPQDRFRWMRRDTPCPQDAYLPHKALNQVLPNQLGCQSVISVNGRHRVVGKPKLHQHDGNLFLERR